MYGAVAAVLFHSLVGNTRCLALLFTRKEVSQPLKVGAQQVRAFCLPLPARVSGKTPSRQFDE